LKLQSLSGTTRDIVARHNDLICSLDLIIAKQPAAAQIGGSREAGMLSPPEGVLRNAVAWLGARGVAVGWVLSGIGCRLTDVFGR
jgi:hypothetical protein